MGSRVSKVRPALAAGAGVALVLSLAPGSRAAPQAREVAPVASYTRSTTLRTLRDLPLKRLITSPAGWERVTQGLKDAPPPPLFAKGQVCLLVVADAAGGARSWVRRLERHPSGELRVVLDRLDGEGRSIWPALECFFLHLPESPLGVRLEHRTALTEGLGTIQRSFPPAGSDALPEALPQLGPDLRLSLRMHDGSRVPAGIQLRQESYFTEKVAQVDAQEGEPVRTERPAKVYGGLFPGDGICFPRIRDGVRHLFAAHGEGLRSRNPLVVEALPRPGPDGSPKPIEHVFLLEPAPR